MESNTVAAPSIPPTAHQMRPNPTICCATHTASSIRIDTGAKVANRRSRRASLSRRPRDRMNLHESSYNRTVSQYRLLPVDVVTSVFTMSASTDKTITIPRAKATAAMARESSDQLDAVLTNCVAFETTPTRARGAEAAPPGTQR